MSCGSFPVDTQGQFSYTRPTKKRLLISISLSVSVKKTFTYAYIRGLYDDIKDYTKEQAHALRDAYLIMFEPELSSIDVSDEEFEKEDIQRLIRENRIIKD